MWAGVFEMMLTFANIVALFYFSKIITASYIKADNTLISKLRYLNYFL